MGLAPAERAQGSVERQVLEPYRPQIAEPRNHFVEHGAADFALPIGERQRAEKLDCVTNLQRGDLGDIEPADPRGERLGPQPPAAAGLARAVAPPAAEE